MSRALLITFGDEVTQDTDLFEAGLVDSYGFVDLVSFIEGTFGITLDEDDLESPEMATLAGIERLIRHKKPSPSIEADTEQE